MELEVLVNGPTDSDTVFLFAHGAGAAMDCDWMNFVAEGIAAQSSQPTKIVRFEFPYMQDRRLNGTKRPPNSQKVLLQYWRDIVADYKSHPRVFIGGKSMGGRMASLVADELGVNGLICLGFPFHAPGKPPQNRIDHLCHIATPTIVIQGERDSMGNREEVESYPLSDQIQLYWLEDGDHSFKPRKKSGHTLANHIEKTCQLIASFINCH